MSFTEAERKKWLEEKRARERGFSSSASVKSQTTGGVGEYEVCFHCNNPFRRYEGTVTSDAAICDVCNY